MYEERRKRAKIVAVVLVVVAIAILAIYGLIESRQEQKAIEIYRRGREEPIHLTAERIKFAEKGNTESKVVAYRITAYWIEESGETHRAAKTTATVLLYYDGLVLTDYNIIDG